MKKLLALSLAAFLSTTLLAQKGKEKTKGQSTTEQREARDIILGRQGDNSKNTSKTGTQKSTTTKGVDPIWEGTRDSDGGGPKPSKNQPAKVRASFARDYPNASNVRWSKYRGEWTATFRNGVATSTAVYHANGQRRDTRTVVPQTEAPRSILDEILKRKPGTRLGDIVKIEVPQAVKDIFRVKTTDGTTTRYLFYSADGREVKYNY